MCADFGLPSSSLGVISASPSISGPANFAVGSKDGTISVWDLYADKYRY
jgi:WD40 repeat protein